jgi:tetratricopeptide (TPR) repeat protein
MMAQSRIDFLSNYRRIPRRPLKAWAETCHRQLLVYSIAAPVDYTNITAIINNVALIFAFLGETDLAQRICKAELSWISEKASRVGVAEAASILRLAINPWINQGRLLGIRGAADQSREYFLSAFSLTSNAEATLGPCRISPRVWTRIDIEDPQLKYGIESAYIIESLKTFFASGDFAAGLQFCRDTRRTRATKYVVEEGLLICLSRLGKYEEAVDLIKRSQNDADIYFEAILLLYELSCRQERGNLLSQCAQRLAISVFAGAFDSISGPTLLRFMSKHGAILEEMGELRLAIQMYNRGWCLARVVQDQPFEWIFLRDLMRVSASAQIQHEDDYAKLIESCEYYNVRKAEGLPLLPLDDIFGELFHLIEAVTLCSPPGTRDYGNTKSGADAQVLGNRAANNERHP